MTQANGTFDVTVKTQPADGHSDGAAMGRMTIDKVYRGDLDGTGKGQMLTGMSAERKDSGVYVAIEKFVGTLAGKSGSFLMHHTGVMNRGGQLLKVTIVPDSGTEQLKGIAGTMGIDIAKDGTHSYALDYSITAR